MGPAGWPGVPLGATSWHHPLTLSSSSVIISNLSRFKIEQKKEACQWFHIHSAFSALHFQFSLKDLFYQIREPDTLFKNKIESCFLFFMVYIHWFIKHRHNINSQLRYSLQIISGNRPHDKTLELRRYLI